MKLGSRGPKYEDLSGQRFGLITLTEPYRHRGFVAWKGVCDCGKNVRIICARDLKRGAIKSCGCYRTENQTKHGAAVRKNIESLYHVWRSIKARCLNKNNTSFKYYGGRGISMCKKWKESYIGFRNWAVKNGYEKGLTIDRIDNDGNYSPKNCRWVTQAENNRNRIHWTKK